MYIKKTIIAVVAFILLAANMQANFAQGIEDEISDIENHWSKKSFERWMDVDIVQGNEMSSVEPDRVMTKIEYITVLNRLLGLEKVSSQTLGNVSSDSWYESEILKALEVGYIQGSEQNGQIYVNIYSPLTRKETAKLFCKAFDLEKVITETSSFVDTEKLTDEELGYIQAMQAIGSVSGYPDGSFKPNNILTRAEMMSLLDKGIKAYYSTPGVYSDKVEGLVVINGENITLKSSTLKGNVIVTEKASKDIVVEDSKILGEMIVKNSEKSSTIAIKGDTEIKKLSVTGSANFNLGKNVKIKLLNVEDRESKVTFGGSGKVEEVVSRSNDIKLNGVSSSFKKQKEVSDKTSGSSSHLKGSSSSSSSGSSSRGSNSGSSNSSANDKEQNTSDKKLEAFYELKNTFIGAPTVDCRIYENDELLRGVSLYVNGQLVARDSDNDGVIRTVKNYFDASARITYSSGQGQIKTAKKK